MSKNKAKRAYLVLADGTVFHGYSMGAVGVTIGEVVFNTCTASYQELLSDPTYYGQIVAQTYPLVGNRGVENNSDFGIMANGYIAREWCDITDDLHGEITLHDYLLSRNIVGICGIDTRRLTRTLRDKGYFNGAITDTLENIDELMKQIKAYTISGAVEAVTIKETIKIPSHQHQFQVVVIDYGFPRTMLASLSNRGCDLVIVPANTSVDEILSYKPDGIVYSDGPADPDDNPALILNIKQLIAHKIPALGIGLGHQMMALALGGTIEKLKQGHRGSNQPVKNLETQRIMITTQNHGYSVASGSISEDEADVTMVNINDGSVEGVIYKAFPGISVQFTPIDGESFQHTAWIFDRFISLMTGGSCCE